jgi:hypothetical protein
MLKGFDDDDDDYAQHRELMVFNFFQHMAI